MLERVRAAGLGCWLGTMPELGVASAQGLHFAALEGLNYPTDIEASVRSQFTKMFGDYGFDASRDIAGIVANRWGHAYVVSPSR